MAHLVVMEMIPVLRILVTHVNVRQPLHHTTPDPAGDKHAAREAMVWVKELSILLVSDQHIHGRIERMTERQCCAVRPVNALGQLSLGPAKVHKPAIEKELISTVQ